MLPTGPSGDTVAASSGQGNTLRRQPWATRRQSRIQPKPCVQPENELGVLAEAADATTISAVKMHTSKSE